MALKLNSEGFQQYEFFKGSKATDNPIKLTTNDVSCCSLLFDNLRGKEDFMRMGEMDLLKGEALEAYRELK